MRPRARGLALATTLYVAFVVLLFGMTLATLASYQYQFARERVDGDRALEAAQAALAQTMYDLAEQPSWGTHGERKDGAVDADAAWTVSFGASSGFPISVNNLAGHGRVAGWQGQVVPPWSALVAVQGRCGRQVRVVEAIVQYASFPYAVAADGPVSSDELLVVGGVPSLDSLLQLQPLALLGGGGQAPVGSVYGGTSVRSGGPAAITGRVRSPGTVTLAPGSVVAGGVERKGDVLPDLAVQAWSCRDFESVTELQAGGTYSVIRGPTYVSGDVRLSGALLDNAYLFVDGGGTLVSQGGLQGIGTIFVTGQTRLEGNLNLVAGTGIAIFSQGDLQIQGGSWFQGVLYSHGSIDVSEGITVVGAVVAQGAAGPAVRLHRGATVQYLEDFTRFGSSWASAGMRGSLLAGDQPMLRIAFWREMP